MHIACQRHGLSGERHEGAFLRGLFLEGSSVESFFSKDEYRVARSALSDEIMGNPEFFHDVA